MPNVPHIDAAVRLFLSSSFPNIMTQMILTLVWLFWYDFFLALI